MTHDGGLPYEECARAQRLSPRRDRTPLSPGYAMPPFHPSHPPRPAPEPAPGRGTSRRPSPRSRPYVGLDGATVSGLLTVLCVATLLLTITVAV